MGKYRKNISNLILGDKIELQEFDRVREWEWIVKVLEVKDGEN